MIGREACVEGTCTPTPLDPNSRGNGSGLRVVCVPAAVMSLDIDIKPVGEAIRRNWNPRGFGRVKQLRRVG